MSDLISRQAVLDLKTIAPIAPVMNGETVHYEEVVFVRDLEKLSSVEPERKPGKWEWNQRTGEYECSECGCNPTYEGVTPDVDEIDNYRFCRWCGAKMEVDA